MSRRYNRFNNDFQFLKSSMLLLYNEIRDAQLLETDKNILEALGTLAKDAEKIASRLRQIERIAEGEQNGLRA